MKLMVRAHDLGVNGEENIARRLGELGLDGVQLVAYKSIDDVAYEEGSITNKRAEEIADAISKLGRIALLGAYFNPVHPNPEKVERGIAVFTDYLKLASTFGAPAVGSESGSYMGDPWGYHPDNASDEALSRVTEIFADLAARAEEYGTSIALEGAFNHVLSSPRRLKTCVDSIGRANYLDISNHASAFDILDEAIELFSGNILLYHIKDFVVEDGRLCQVGVGRGELDLERLIRRINLDDPEATLVLEGTTGDDLPYAIEKLRSIINSL